MKPPWSAKSLRAQLLSFFPESSNELSIHEIGALLPEPVAERTLRRWLAKYVESGQLERIGQKRASKYLLRKTEQTAARELDLDDSLNIKFLDDIPEQKKPHLLKQLRDLWTHTSTALEGNTLTLGDTHFVLEEGLTISGKPLKDHQEILGHARAIQLLYQSLNNPLGVPLCFELHKAIQTEIVLDIDKPNGTWKVQPNGTYTVAQNDQPMYLEYALPQHVPVLMGEVIRFLNSSSSQKLSLHEAHKTYAKIHAAIAHIHPFWDGNGRIARLLANIPVLKSGLPPIIIPKENRREYIQILATYELKAGQLNSESGAWPKPELLENFEAFCLRCYQTTLGIVQEYQSS